MHRLYVVNHDSPSVHLGLWAVPRMLGLAKSHTGTFFIRTRILAPRNVRRRMHTRTWGRRISEILWRRSVISLRCLHKVAHLL